MIHSVTDNHLITASKLPSLSPLIHLCSFMSVLLPCRNTLLRSRTTQRPSRRIEPNQYLEPTVERELATMIVMETDFLLRLEEQKRELYHLREFDFEAIFWGLANSHDVIDEAQIRRFLIAVGHQPHKQELLNIMRRLDLNANRCLSIRDFYEALIPMSLQVNPIMFDHPNQIDHSNCHHRTPAKERSRSPLKSPLRKSLDYHRSGSEDSYSTPARELRYSHHKQQQQCRHNS